MSDQLTTTVIISPEGDADRLTRHLVTLPDTSGYVYTADCYSTRSQRHKRSLCLPFSLPPPSQDIYRPLQKAALTRQVDLAHHIDMTVQEWAKGQAAAKQAGVFGNSTLTISPYPAGQCVSYLMTYAYTPDEFFSDLSKWLWCDTCGEAYEAHIGRLCSFELGLTFKSGYPASLDRARRVVEFNNSFTTWLTECVDAIYAMALEKLSEQKTSTYVGGHARGEFTPLLDDTEGRSIATTSSGAGDPVP